MGLANARARMFSQFARVFVEPCRQREGATQGVQGSSRGLATAGCEIFRSYRAVPRDLQGKRATPRNFQGCSWNLQGQRGGLIGVCGGVPRTYQESCCQGFAQLVMETLMDRSETSVGFQGCSQGSAGEGGAFQWFAWCSHGLGICEHEGL